MTFDLYKVKKRCHNRLRSTFSEVDLQLEYLGRTSESSLQWNVGRFGNLHTQENESRPSHLNHKMFMRVGRVCGYYSNCTSLVITWESTASNASSPPAGEQMPRYHRSEGQTPGSGPE